MRKRKRKKTGTKRMKKRRSRRRNMRRRRRIRNTSFQRKKKQFPNLQLQTFPSLRLSRLVGCTCSPSITRNPSSDLKIETAMFTQASRANIVKRMFFFNKYCYVPSTTSSSDCRRQLEVKNRSTATKKGYEVMLCFVPSGHADSVLLTSWEWDFCDSC